MEQRASDSVFTHWMWPIQQKRMIIMVTFMLFTSLESQTESCYVSIQFTPLTVFQCRGLLFTPFPGNRFQRSLLAIYVQEMCHNAIYLSFLTHSHHESHPLIRSLSASQRYLETVCILWERQMITHEGDSSPCRGLYHHLQLSKQRLVIEFIPLIESFGGCYEHCIGLWVKHTESNSRWIWIDSFPVWKCSLF